MTQYLTQKELAHRWRMSPRTLERWRWLKVGCPYVKIGGRCLYPLESVVAFESGSVRNEAHARSDNVARR